MTAGQTPSFPLFVIGSGRSGTTLLYSILNAHPLIRLQNEANIIAPVLSRGLDLDRLVRATEALRSIERSLPRRGRGRVFLARSEVARALAERNEPTTLVDLLGALLKGPAPRPIWGEKSLQLGFVLGPLLALFPESRIIHLVRDPRDAVLSFCEKRRAGTTTETQPDWPLVHFYAREWYLTHQAIEAAQPPHRLLLRYEHLARDPQAAVARICAFLGVDFAPEMLDPAVWRPGLQAGEWQAHRNLRHAVRDSQIGRAETLPPVLLKCIEDRARLMERYGYQRWQARGFSSRQFLLACRYLRHLFALRKQSRPMKLARTARRA